MSAVRVLIVTAIALIACTMVFGVAYALLDEHQTLEAMGFYLASSFIEASRGDMEAANIALDRYAAVKAEYGLEVHSHGHWGMLALVLIILGLYIDRLGFSQRQSLALAWLLALSGSLFPVGVLLQIGAAAEAGRFVSMAAALGMLSGMLIAACGAIRNGRPTAANR